MTDNEWLEQVVALRQQIARETMEARDGALREQTAATILAACIQAHAIANQRSSYALDIPDYYAMRAVKWTDALRAALAKGGGE